jgi:hypothetical protein
MKLHAPLQNPLLRNNHHEKEHQFKSNNSIHGNESIDYGLEMSSRNIPGGKGQLACKADNLTTIYELTV